MHRILADQVEQTPTNFDYRYKLSSSTRSYIAFIYHNDYCMLVQKALHEDHRSQSLRQVQCRGKGSNLSSH
jgi:hypothetical protein